MEEHSIFIMEKEISNYVKISNLIADKFSKKIYAEDIVDQVLKQIPPEEINEHTEEHIKNVIFNRQLMAERFI